METINTMDLIRGINRERYPIQVLHTNRTIKALRVKRLASRPQNSIGDCPRAQGALLQQLHVAALTERLLLHGIEMLTLQGQTTALAVEAANVEELIHGPQSIVSAVDLIVALHAHAKEIWITTRVQILHKQVLQQIHFID